MKSIRIHALAIVAFLVTLAGVSSRAGELVRREWTVHGVTREALVYIPPHASTQPTPVIFAFHGHGGTMRDSERSWDYHTLWPDALVVYPQGLKTPGALTDPSGGKFGWQRSAGDQGDRDLAFFDAMFASLRKDYPVDDHRIYCTGHSNGGSFTYLLWGERGELFAAFAPSSAVDAKSFPKLKPKPVFHVAGETDRLVKFSWQKQMIASLLRLNQCDVAPPLTTGCVTHVSKISAPVVTLIHGGGHTFPRDAPALIIAFFKDHPKP